MTVEVPITVAVEVPITDAVEVPFTDAVEVPITDAVEVPITDAVEVPITDAVEVPITDAVEVPITDAVEVPITDAVEVPITDAVEVPITGAVDVQSLTPLTITSGNTEVTEPRWTIGHLLGFLNLTEMDGLKGQYSIVSWWRKFLGSFRPPTFLCKAGPGSIINLMTSDAYTHTGLGPLRAVVH
ncbi:uncharacterized protein LOC117318864 [Pecten maximus]|uniref:uncharacterized protein LOC117318864 n=1 Tax=Pecten maximus TaxID=6579 RepID=UPI00145884B9|nr:uncharacterized protein LOC117318864 [Pecten maximus]